MTGRLAAIGVFAATCVAAWSCGPVVAEECERDDQCSSGERCDAASRLCVVDPDGGGDPLTLAGGTLPEAVQGQSWSRLLEASGGIPPYTWSLQNVSAVLSWLHLEAETGWLSGTPPAVLPSTSFDVEVQDGDGAKVRATFLLSVRACSNGEKVPCASPGDGVCLGGEQTCESGVLGACVTSGPSNRVEACGADCSACDPKIADTCTGGACGCGTEAACATGQSCCGGTCVDTDTDPDRCGGCSTVCDTSRTNVQRTCSAGKCDFPCADGWGRCGANEGAASCETDLLTDEANCGTCGVVCPTGATNATGVTCENGGCKVSGCQAGYADCDGKVVNGCERNLQTDPDFCGSCNNACPNGANGSRTCSNGQCGIVCNANYGNCDGSLANGCEVDLRTNAVHCGACGTSCGGPANTVSHCSNKVCGWTCKANWANCNNQSGDGCEVNLLTSVNHCGTCGKSCDACSSGVCGRSCSTLTCWEPSACDSCPIPGKPSEEGPCCI